MSNAAVCVARWVPSTRVKQRHSSLLLTSETVTPQRECRLRDICYRDSRSAMEEGCHVAFCPSEAKCYTQKSCHASWLSPASSYAPRAATMSVPVPDRCIAKYVPILGLSEGLLSMAPNLQNHVDMEEDSRIVWLPLQRWWGWP
jgi:hypothetical protein